MANWTVAVAGSGEVTVDNAVALLDDWLPVENVGVLFPKLGRKDKTLRGILDWAKEDMDVMEDQENLVAALAGAKKDGDEVYLVLAWDDTETSSKMLEQALEVEIPVKDLTRALDDLEFEDAEPASEPEPTTRRSRKKATDNGAEADTPWDASAEDSDSADAGHVDDTGGADTSVSEHGDDADVVQATTMGPAVIAPMGKPALKTDNHSFAALALETLIREIIRDEYKKLTAKPETKSVPALMDEDGNYQLGGKGRPPKGWTAVKLTPTEARAVGIEVPEE